MKGTVWVVGSKSLLKIKKPEIFLEAHEFYGQKYYAECVARIHNAGRKKSGKTPNPKWHVIKIQFTAEIEEL